MTLVHHDKAKYLTHFISQDNIVCLLENLIRRCARWIYLIFRKRDHCNSGTCQRLTAMWSPR